MGVVEGFGGWEFAELPTFDRSNVPCVDDLIPDARWFWGALANYCVPACCGVRAFDFRQSYVAWVTHVTDQEAPEIKGLFCSRPDEPPELDPLIRELEEAANSLNKMSEPVVSSERLNQFFRTDELAELFLHLTSAMQGSSTDM